MNTHARTKKKKRTDLGIRHDDHDVGVAREHVDERGKVGRADLHRLELRLRLAAAELELFYDVGDLLEPVHVAVVGAGRVGDDEERCAT